MSVNYKIENSRLSLDALQFSFSSTNNPSQRLSNVPIIKYNHQVSWGSNDFDGSLTIQNPTSYTATTHPISNSLFSKYALLQDRTTTSDAVATIIQTINLPAKTSCIFKTNIIGKRTTGAGNPGDRNCFVYNFVGDTNASGTATVSGITSQYIIQSNVSTAVTISTSSNSIVISVTGVSGETFIWYCNTEMYPSYPAY